MKERTLVASWKKLWPKKITHDYEGFTPEEVHHSAVDRAVRLARLVATEGFSDMTSEDVNSLIECHSTPPTDEDLVDLTKSASEEEEEAADNGDEEEECGLTLENLQELFNMVHDVKKKAQEIDDNMVRAIEFCNRIDGDMELYKSIFVLCAPKTCRSSSCCHYASFCRLHAFFCFYAASCSLPISIRSFPRQFGASST